MPMDGKILKQLISTWIILGVWGKMRLQVQVRFLAYEQTQQISVCRQTQTLAEATSVSSAKLMEIRREPGIVWGREVSSGSQLPWKQT